MSALMPGVSVALVSSIPYCARIELRGLPKTTPGAYGNWSGLGGERERWRNLARDAATLLLPAAPAHPISVRLRRHSSMPIKPYSLAISMEPILDGLCDAGLEYSVSTSEWRRAMPREGKIEIILGDA